jgi:hypothetical protein
MTTGYDGSVLNGLQAVETWQTCMSGSPEEYWANRIRLQYSQRRSPRCAQRIV